MSRLPILTRARRITAVLIAVSAALSTTLESQTATIKQPAATQSPISDSWEAAAGGKISFDVASVKQNNSESKPQSNVKLNNLRKAYAPTGGLFTATNWPVITYIAFAYKLTDQQVDVMVKGLPEWVFNDRFDIEAKSDNQDPTKDQMRLMLQSLLEDRFRLTVHKETRQVSVLALVVAKRGKTGPQLKQHTEDSPCPARDPISSPISAPAAAILKAWPPNCDHIRDIEAEKSIRLAGRRVTMQMIADALSGMGELLGDRLVIDQTGLKDTFDFVMDFASESPSAEPGRKTQAQEPLPTLEDALNGQLGLKLLKQTAPIDSFIVDHIDHPTPN